MTSRVADILVIGSGFGAAAPALRLAEAGAKVLVVEKGRYIDPRKDFEQTQSPAYYQRYFRTLDSDHLAFHYIEALGGGSGFYDMASFRAPSLAFRQTFRGRTLWPEGLDRPLFDPYYARAEQMLSVRQIPAERVPKNGLLFARMLSTLGYSVDRARYAESGCLSSGYCQTGCIYGAKQSLLLTYLPAAVTAGAEILADTEVREIRPGRGGGYEVLARDAEGHAVHLFAPVVVLGGGTLGTAKLLLASRRLKELSPQVGHNVVHNGCTKTAALLGDHLPDGDLFRGQPHAGMISYHFLDSDGVTLCTEKPLPLQVVAAARLSDPEGEPATGWWGQDHVALMGRLRARGFILAALGFTPPTATLRLRGDRLDLDLPLEPELEDYLVRTERIFDTILDGNGCKRLNVAFLDRQGQPYPGVHLSGAHQMGSACMADRPEDGVVDRFGEVFGHPDLYVTDGAAIPSSLAVNPSLTILANAERIADTLVQRYAG